MYTRVSGFLGGVLSTGLCMYVCAMYVLIYMLAFSFQVSPRRGGALQRLLVDHAMPCLGLSCLGLSCLGLIHAFLPCLRDGSLGPLLVGGHGGCCGWWSCLIVFFPLLETAVTQHQLFASSADLI